MLFGEKLRQIEKKLSNLELEIENWKSEVFNNEQLKIQQNQKRLDYLEMKDSQSVERFVSLESRIDNIENWINEVFSNEKLKTQQNQTRLDAVENELRMLRRQLISGNNSQRNGGMEEFDFLNKRTNSQSGEDAILAYVLARLKLPFESCRYLDLGANHPVKGSNTNFFYQRGSSGVLVEANPDLIPDLEKLREGDVILNRCIDSRDGASLHFYIMSDDGLSTPNKEQVEEIQNKNPEVIIKREVDIESITVNHIMETYFNNRAPEILSIDIEGKDLEILQSIDFQKYRPLLVVIEMIDYEAEDISYKKNMDIYNYMIQQDYHEYAFTGINSIFIDKKSKRLITKG